MRGGANLTQYNERAQRRREERRYRKMEKDGATEKADERIQEHAHNGQAIRPQGCVSNAAQS
jgi:hypothetical protein